MIKFILYFTISFIILSIPVSEDKALFDIANQLAKPYTTKLFIKIKTSISENISDAKELPSRFFDNTSEKDANVIDRVIEKKSALNKKKIFESSNDNYTREEKEAILQILRNNQDQE